MTGKPAFAAGLVTLLAVIPAAPSWGSEAAPSRPAEPFSTPPFEAPHHGSRDRIAFGGHGELRFGHDRVAGVANPDWFSVGRVNGFVRAWLHPRVELLGQAAAWDRGADDFVLESAELEVRVRDRLHVHAGIFLTPLGSTNLHHDAPRNEFAEPSLAATEIIGVPNAHLGAGIRGTGSASGDWLLSYELDLVTGYDDGLIMDSPGGTRLPRGRNNYGDQNGVPAIAGRLAAHRPPRTEIGLAVQSGQYNTTRVGGVRVDDPRYIHVAVGDAATRMGRFRLAGEAAVAIVDVPPGLRGLFAEWQWGASIEAARTVSEPIFRAWSASSLSVAVRADAVDLDQAIPGDSRSRLSASFNVHQQPFAVTRLGWYYEIRRDRFNNETPMAGIILSAASYF